MNFHNRQNLLILMAHILDIKSRTLPPVFYNFPPNDFFAPEFADHPDFVHLFRLIVVLGRPEAKCASDHRTGSDESFDKHSGEIETGKSLT